MCCIAMCTISNQMPVFYEPRMEREPGRFFFICKSFYTIILTVISLISDLSCSPLLICCAVGDLRQSQFVWDTT